MNSSAPQHSLDAFRRYERDIAQILRNYPKETLIDPAPLSNETYINRCRDAIKGMLLNNWISDIFTISDCQRVFKHLGSEGNFVFSYHSNGNLRVGEKRRLELSGTINPIDTVFSVDAGELDGRDEQLFSSILYLKNLDVITDHAIFKNLTTNQLTQVETAVNVELIDEGLGKHILLCQTHIKNQTRK